MLQDLIKNYPQFEGQLRGGIIAEDIIDAELQQVKSEQGKERNGNMENKKGNQCARYSDCVHKCTPNQNNKLLRKCESTSILCDRKLLDENNRLTVVAENRDNVYYKVLETNSVIMHVEDGFCILTEDRVQVYDKDNQCSLPVMLSAFHYGVYQIQRMNKKRDWVKRDDKNTIGNDTRTIIHGETAVTMARAQGMTLDHGAETWNEQSKHGSFKVDNRGKSHRVCVDIRTQEDLNAFLDDIITYGGTNDGIYFDTETGKRTDRGRKFVKFR